MFHAGSSNRQDSRFGQLQAARSQSRLPIDPIPARKRALV